MTIYLLFADNIDDLNELENACPDVKKNHKYNELKEKRLRGSVEERASNKYIKKFAKGIWKNLMAADKKFLLTK